MKLSEARRPAIQQENGEGEPGDADRGEAHLAPRCAPPAQEKGGQGGHRIVLLSYRIILPGP